MSFPRPKVKAHSILVFVFGLLACCLPISWAHEEEKNSPPQEGVIVQFKAEEGIPSSLQESLDQVGNDGEMLFDVEGAMKGVSFLGGYEELIQGILGLSQELMKHMHDLEKRHGQESLEVWRAQNHRIMTIYHFADGYVTNGEESKDERLHELPKEHGKLLFKAEPVTLTSGHGHRELGELAIKVVDYDRNITFILDSGKDFSIYRNRQNYLAGKSSNSHGRDVVHLTVDMDDLSKTPTDSEYIPRLPFFSKEGFKRRWRAIDQPILWPASWLEAFWHMGCETATGLVTACIVRHFYPEQGVNNLMTYFTIGFGMGFGLKNGTNRNFVNGGFGFFDRVLRRSFTGMIFAVSYSIAFNEGVAHLKFTDTAGLTNWAMILINILLDKAGTDPITDAARIRTELRANTRHLVFVPPAMLPSMGEPVTLSVGKRKVTFKNMRANAKEVYIAMPGLKEPWHSNVKQQAIEGPLMKIPANFTKLLDQITMGVLSAPGTVTDAGMLFTAWAYLKTKLLLMAQIPVGRRLVLWYAEKKNFEDAPKMREQWDSTMTPKGWWKGIKSLYNQFGEFSLKLAMHKERALSQAAASCFRAFEGHPKLRP